MNDGSDDDDDLDIMDHGSRRLTSRFNINAARGLMSTCQLALVVHVCYNIMSANSGIEVK